MGWDGMGWDRHKLLWDGMGQKNMSHGQACQLPIITGTISCVISAVSFSITACTFTIATISE